MIKISPPYVVLPVLKWVAGTFSVMLLMACSTPTKYPLRVPLENNTQTPTSEHKAPTVYTKISPETTLPTNVCGDVYRVKSGDSLSEIALHCQVSMKKLAQHNQIFPPYTIYKNQRLTIPQNSAQPYSIGDTDLKHPVTQPSQNPPTIKASTPTVVQKSLKKAVKQQTWLWPVHKSLPYRFIRDDAGLSIIEIYGVAGQEVKAVSGGSVVYSGEGITEFGKMVVIKHDDEYMSVYAHNSDLLVQEGDYVQAGQQIGTLGATGNTNQPKLYLEARFKGRKVDILKVLTVPKSN